MSWSEAEVRRLERLMEQGLTRVQMASVLGKTKGAVSGRVHRLRLSPFRGDYAKESKRTMVDALILEGDLKRRDIAEQAGVGVKYVDARKAALRQQGSIPPRAASVTRSRVLAAALEGELDPRLVAQRVGIGYRTACEYMKELREEGAIPDRWDAVWQERFRLLSIHSSAKVAEITGRSLSSVYDWQKRRKKR